MSRAPRIPNAQWEKHKPTIHNLYISQEKKLEDVIKLMADKHGFQPTKAQYVRKLDSWDFKKNSSKKEWGHAVAVVQKRKLEGKETELQMNGKVISTKKLRKELGRYAYLQSFSWASSIEPGNDLEAVVARTPPSSLSSGSIMPNYLPWFQFQDYLVSILIPRSPPVSNPERPLPEQNWAGILEAKGPHSQFYESLSHHSVTMPGRPGDDMHVQLQRLSQAQPFLQAVQRVIYLSSNNLLSYGETNDFLKWVTESGNMRALKEIINRKESTCQVFACQLLPNAVGLRNAELVSAILTRDARSENDNIKIPEDAIAIAVCSGNSRIVQLLLHHLTAVNTSDSSRHVGQYLNTANTRGHGQFRDAFLLSTAIRYGDVTMVRSLLDAGASVNNVADTPISALHVAVEEQRLEMIEILLQAGADVNIPLGEGYHEFCGMYEGRDIPESPLQVAAAHGMSEIVQQLLQESADIDATWFTSIEMFKGHVKANFDGLFYWPPWTALEQALRFGHVETAEILLNAGANIEGHRLGPTALQAACGSHRLDRLGAARLLLSRGADVNAAAGICFGRTALQAAAERGDMALVQFLLDKDANVNSRPCDHGGITALQAAARSGNQDLVQALVEEGGHVNAKPAEYLGATCLQAAASSGNKNIVRMLLEHGAETNAPASDRGETALSAAVSRDHVEVAKMLLEAGALVNQVEDGPAPLSLAILNHSHELFELLMKYGADPNPPGVRYTPLASAVAQKDLEMVSILLSAGADPNTYSSSDYHSLAEPPLVGALQNPLGPSLSIVQVLVEHGANVNKPSWKRAYPVMLAFDLPDYDEAKSAIQLLLDAGADLKLLSGNMGRIDVKHLRWELLRMLLDRGANINAPISIQGTVLQLAVQGGHTDIVQELISRGADINTPADPQRAEGTALQLAVQGGHTDIVQELISRGADIDAPGCPPRGKTALQLAVERGNIHIVQELISRGADIDAPGCSPHGRTALQLAIERDNLQIVQELISRGADINAPGCPQQERTVLQLALERGNLQIVQELISCGADINTPACPQWGRTALQLAVVKNNIRIARKLISCGADVNAPPASVAGATALQFAAMNGNIEMAVLLLQNQAEVNAGRASFQGRTALEGAAENGRLDMVYLLLENDQDLETIEERCRDAAKFAEKWEHFEIARILREWRRS